VTARLRVEDEQAVWLEAGKLVARREQNSNWEMAWWLAEGQGKAFDPCFARSMVILQRARPTLENYCRVGRAFPRGRNNDLLSFDTHRALLREPDETSRLLVLSMAIENHWFANDVEHYFDLHPPTARGLVGVDRPSSNPRRTLVVERKRDGYSGAHVKCPECAHVFPVKGHKAPGPGVTTKGDSNAVASEVAP